MNLCIDIGNSRAKSAVFAGGKLIKHSLDFDFQLKDIDKLYQRYAFEHAILSSTRSNIHEYVKVLKQFVPLKKLDHTLPVPVLVHYDTPETLGPDRLAAVCGAAAMFKDKNCLVVDAGTCVTYDFVDGSCQYYGGNIAPGIMMRLQAMHDYTSKLPLVEKSNIDHVLGKTTNEALKNGAIQGILYEIRGLSDRLEKEKGEINIILTGGDALFLAENVKKEIFVVPNLVLLGLNEILLYNLENEE